MKKMIFPPLFYRFWELFAWTTLVLAFAIGQIASKPDYIPLAKKMFPEFDWQPSEIYKNLPVVLASKPGFHEEALVIATGNGFGGPFILGVKAKKTEDGAILNEVVVLQHKETPPYLEKLIKKRFLRQFTNKQISNDFIAGVDVDAVSGATVTSRAFTQAISNSMHKGAIDHLNMKKTWKEETWSLGLNEYLAFALFTLVLAAVYAPRSIARKLKLILPFAALAFVGFYVNASISLGTLAGIVMGYIPSFKQQPIWWIFVGGTLGGIVLLGRNLYCGLLCPFSVVQSVLQKISGIKLAITPAMAKASRKVIYTMSWFALILIFVSRHPAMGSYEPFSMMFSLNGLGIQWYLLPLTLLGSLIIPEFWCRLFCPVGLYLSEGVRLRNASVRKIRNIIATDATIAINSKPVTDCVTILYGSESGNAKQVSLQIKESIEANAMIVRCMSMHHYCFDEMQKEQQIILVSSTHGEGMPPQNAERLYNWIMSEHAPNLSGVGFSVVGLGDRTYKYFCQTGKDFDRRLHELGAQRLIARADFDVDFFDDVDSWITNAIDIYREQLGSSCANVVLPQQPAQDTGPGYDRNQPFSATVINNARLSSGDGVREFRHIELSIENSGISYQPGDLVGLWFHNDGKQVDELLTTLQIDGDEQVQVGLYMMGIRQALISEFELTQCSVKFIELYSRYVNSAELDSLLDNQSALRDYVRERQVYDVVDSYPARINVDTLVSCLYRMTPRKYSISSSQLCVADAIHLTVAVVRSNVNGVPRRGGASGYLSTCVKGDEVQIFVENSEVFNLPKNSDADIIMIGPGTGIAPFRAFLQQRHMQNHSGKNWLFFGNRRRQQDFLYNQELDLFRKQGVLNNLSLAFSRDQAEKVYVQQRILERGAQLYWWLENGAYIYLCGDATHMAKDVEAAIIEVIAIYQGDIQTAQTYLQRLKHEGRYVLDVY